MLKKLFPYNYVDSVFVIDYEKLMQTGIKALLFDIDNTLVYHGTDSTPQVDSLINNLQQMGFKILLITDNDEERTLRLMKNFKCDYICDAEKPSSKSYNKALEILGVNNNEAVVIGDQIFKDILGANNSNIPSILVKFIRLKSETNFGKRRKAEDIILKIYNKSRKYKNRFGNITKN